MGMVIQLDSLASILRLTHAARDVVCMQCRTCRVVAKSCRSRGGTLCPSERIILTFPLLCRSLAAFRLYVHLVGLHVANPPIAQLLVPNSNSQPQKIAQDGDRDSENLGSPGGLTVLALVPPCEDIGKGFNGAIKPGHGMSSAISQHSMLLRLCTGCIDLS